MKWYSAKILYATAISGDLDAGKLYEVSIRILKSTDKSSALIKAEEIGRSCEHSYDNTDGELVTWKFMRILEVQDLDIEHLEEGAEVYSTMYLKEDYSES